MTDDRSDVRAIGYVMGTLAATLVLAALVLAVDNPEIGSTSRGEHYSCLAPWDTVLNDADNYPGGEPPPDGDQIAARCRDVGADRFHLAAGVGLAAAVVAVLAGAVGTISWRRDNRPST